MTPDDFKAGTARCAVRAPERPNKCGEAHP